MTSARASCVGWPGSSTSALVSTECSRLPMPCGVAGLGVQRDRAPARAERLLELGEPVARRGGVLAEAQPDQAEALGAHPLGDDGPLALGHPEVALAGRADRERHRRLAAHRREDGGLDRGGEREAAAEAHADDADARAARRAVQVPGQRPDVLGDRPVGALARTPRTPW